MHTPVPVLSARGLSKTYSGGEAPVHALRGIDLTIEPGEFTAVMGPSGCGKSTLLHLLGGLDRPTTGEIWFGERRVDTLSESAWSVLRRTQVGFVFQFFNLIGNMSVADNIELPATLIGTPPREVRRRRDALLSELGIPDKARAIPGHLSGGQQQRVAIARALINQPTVLLADEPTGNLDSGSAADVLNLLRCLHAAGQTILIVTHDARVASVAERVITMRDGCINDDTRLSGESVPYGLTSRMQLEV